jgi:transcription initiation factor IIF auxiliary subunit
MKLFTLKKKLIREILYLKSAYSIIDQMFNMEMENAKVISSRWYYWFFCLNEKNGLIDPLTMNEFICKLMDPFNNQNNVIVNDDEFNLV